MNTKHFYERMGERVYNNKKGLTNKEKKSQKNASKTFLKKIVKNKIAEYIDIYGIKYVYTRYEENYYKVIFNKNRAVTIYEVDFEKEKNKYNLKYV